MNNQEKNVQCVQSAEFMSLTGMHMISQAPTNFCGQCIFVHLDHTQGQYQMPNFKQTVVFFRAHIEKKQATVHEGVLP